ncbi:hypothetical protein F5887DRAFT_1289020, partial [Amanita rubescens]
MILYVPLLALVVAPVWAYPQFTTFSTGWTISCLDSSCTTIGQPPTDFPTTPSSPTSTIQTSPTPSLTSPTSPSSTLSPSTLPSSTLSLAASTSSTPATATAANSSSQSQSSKTNVGEIVGIAVGCAVGVGGLLILAWWKFCRPKGEDPQRALTPSPSDRQMLQASPRSTGFPTRLSTETWAHPSPPLQPSFHQSVLLQPSSPPESPPPQPTSALPSPGLSSLGLPTPPLSTESSAPVQPKLLQTFHSRSMTDLPPQDYADCELL